MTCERAVALAIPPAWTDVWIASHANGHVQATGVDDVGRRQYLYHPAWRERKDGIKFGSERNAAEQWSFGLSTLLCAHASVSTDDVVELTFPAKSGQEWESDIRDPDLATLVRRLKRRGPTSRGEGLPTPAIARGSYVDPRLLDADEGGVTIDPARGGCRVGVARTAG